jgi:hypothetical protein
VRAMKALGLNIPIKSDASSFVREVDRAIAKLKVLAWLNAKMDRIEGG